MTAEAHRCDTLVVEIATLPIGATQLRLVCPTCRGLARVTTMPPSSAVRPTLERLQLALEEAGAC